MSNSFIYSDQYIEFTTRTPSQNVFGLGDRAAKFRYSNGVYTIWNKDQPEKIDIGQPGNNLYGTHPMWLCREKSGNFHAILLRNSNAMDIVISDADHGRKSLQFKVIGGILDFRFFLGNDDPEQVVERYHRYLGGWFPPPFWGFGN